MTDDCSQPSGARRSRGGEGGATLVEAALVTPVLMLLVFGVIEFGVIYRDYVTAADSTTVGARIGSIVGPGLADVRVSDGLGGTTTIEGNGDFAAMMAVRENLSAVPVDWIERIIIFKGDRPSEQTSPTDQVPADCKSTAVVPGNRTDCNIYDARQAFTRLEGTVDAERVAYFRCVNDTDPACGWDPDGRKNGPKTSDIEYLGVYIKIERPYLTGIFGGSFTIEQAHITRLEPGSLGAS